MAELPLLIKRCLTYRVRVYPHQLEGVLRRYNDFKIPDDILVHYPEEVLQKYVKGLYLSSCEMAGDWTDGLKILTDLGFKEISREDGHRRYLSLVWEEQ